MTRSRSRRSVVSAGLAFVALAALGSSKILGCKALGGRKVANDSSPWLATITARNTEADTDATRAAAFWVMIDSLSPSAQQRFLDNFDDVLTAAEASFDPLGLELGDNPDEAARAFKIFLPQFNAAFAICAPSWPLPGESLQVRASSSRPADDTARRAWGEESDDWARRLRFAAWPVSDAAHLRASSVAEYDRLLVKFREHASLSGSALGVVVTAQVQRTFAQIAQRKQLLELAARAQRLAKASRKKDRIVDLASSPIDTAEPQRVAPWLQLKPLECLIVPRLGTPNRRRALKQAVDELLVGSQVVAIGGGV